MRKCCRYILLVELICVNKLPLEYTIDQQSHDHEVLRLPLYSIQISNTIELIWSQLRLTNGTFS